MNPPLKTILCDLGNVLLFFCHDRMCRQIGELYGRTGEQVRDALFGTPLLGEFERGRIDESAVQRKFAELFGRTADEADLRRAASDIFDVNESLLNVLWQLKGRGLRLVLLSNTSISHIEWVRATYDVLKPFDRLVLSYEVGFVKPEDGIFLAAIQEIGCRPDECLYLDDIPAYVAKGREFGLRGHVFTGTDGVIEELRRSGIEL